MMLIFILLKKTKKFSTQDRTLNFFQHFQKDLLFCTKLTIVIQNLFAQIYTLLEMFKIHEHA